MSVLRRPPHQADDEAPASTRAVWLVTDAGDGPCPGPMGPRRPRRHRLTPRADPERAAISGELARLEALMHDLEALHAQDIARVHGDHLQDAVNLVHYLALRHEDVRLLQRKLGELGLSSLGRCEPHVLATVETVHATVDGDVACPRPGHVELRRGPSALDRNTDALFGPRPPGRVPRIMVTLPYRGGRRLRTGPAPGTQRAWTWPASTAPMTTRTAGSAWHAACAGRPRSRAALPGVDGPPGTQDADRPPRRRATGREAAAPTRPAGRAHRSRRRQRLLGSGDADGQATGSARGRGVARAPPPRRRGRDSSTPAGLPVSSGSSRPPGQLRGARYGTPPTWRRARAVLCGDDTRVGSLSRGSPRPRAVRRRRPRCSPVTSSPAAAWRHGQPGNARIGCTLPAALRRRPGRPAGDPR